MVSQSNTTGRNRGDEEDDDGAGGIDNGTDDDEGSDVASDGDSDMSFVLSTGKGNSKLDTLASPCIIRTGKP